MNSVSVIIRTLNEGRYLSSVLESIKRQDWNGTFNELEVLLVDSGSSDTTLDIAEKHGCTILHIAKEVFSFGRSLNLGCDNARGNVLVFVSGHCIPGDDKWLEALVRPLFRKEAEYVYGAQVGGPETQYSEKRLLLKSFPEVGKIPQEGFFCNNANAAILTNVWAKYRFDEELTGLEDMHLAKRMQSDGHRVGYCSSSYVYHLHDETWNQIRWRYEREAIALRLIMPEVQVSFTDVIRYVCKTVLSDCISAVKERVFWTKAYEIVLFRIMQYWGVFSGHQEHRTVSQERKERYFFPQ